MQELVRGEWIGVNYPLGIGQVRPERLGASTIYGLRLDEVTIKLIQQQEIPGKLDGRDDIAPAAPVSQFRDCFGPPGVGVPMGAACGGAGDTSASEEVGSCCAKPIPGAIRARARAPVRSAR